MGIFDALSSAWDAVSGVASNVYSAAKDLPWGDIGNIAGSAASIGGTLLQSQAANQSAKSQEQAAKIQANAQLAAAQAQKGELYQQATDIEQTAQRQLVAAQLRQAQIRSAGATTAHTANANYAASGVVSGVGSAGVIPRSIVGSAEQDAYTTMMNAQDTIAQLNAQAAANRRHGDVLEAAGQYAAKEGTASAVAAAQSISNANWANTLLGIGNTAVNWARS